MAGLGQPLRISNTLFTLVRRFCGIVNAEKRQTAGLALPPLGAAAGLEGLAKVSMPLFSTSSTYPLNISMTENIRRLGPIRKLGDFDLRLIVCADFDDFASFKST
jgi:hypothetical protein